jgi:type VI secretion system secreted protein Hcp
MFDRGVMQHHVQQPIVTMASASSASSAAAPSAATEGMGLERGRRAADITMLVEGQKQGKLKGGSPKKGRTDLFDLWEVYHGIASPRDAATGMPSGRRVHNAVVVAGETVGGVAQLYTAIFTNENLKKVKIDFYRTNKADGTQKVYYTIEMKNAALTELENLQDETGRPNFRASIGYEEITITWADGNLTATDTWHGTT